MKSFAKKLSVLAVVLCAFVVFRVPHAHAATVNLLVRDGATVIYQGPADIPSSTVTLTDDTGASHSVAGSSVLATLSAAGQASGAYAFSDLQYYSSFGSLYLKCLTATGASPECDNWQFVVNGTSPWTGMDSTMLSGGETVGVYFGFTHQVVFDTTSIPVGGSFTATAQTYNVADNSWSPLAGVTIGLTIPNPSDPYNPTTVDSKHVDTNGSATFIVNAANTYTVGIVEDYYYPQYSVVVGGTGTGGLLTPEHAGGGLPAMDGPSAFNVPSAVMYLESVQSGDGSFGPAMYTDWAAVALGADGMHDASVEKLHEYLLAHGGLSAVLSDNERRAMAVLALGDDPYAFANTDYIDAITKSFDGTQFGDPALVNDDIFALIPLESAGYGSGDDVIVKDAAFILSKQHVDGSWEESPDLTAAAVQALVPIKGMPNVSGALTQAETYLATAQKSDGGYGSVYSTSWAAQAMAAAGATWTNHGATIAQALAKTQGGDGAALPTTEMLQNKIWATSYAIPAALGKPWNAVLHAVQKRIVVAAPIAPVSSDTVVPAVPSAPIVNAVTETMLAAPVAPEASSQSDAAAATSTPEAQPAADQAAAAAGSDRTVAWPIAGGAVVLGAVAGIGARVRARRKKP